MKPLYYLFVISILLLASCRKDNCLGDADTVQTVTRAATTFHQVDVYDNIDVVLTQDTIESISITAPQYLEPNITSKIEDGILTLKNRSSCTWLRNAPDKVTVHVHLKKLDKIIYAGSGSITTTNTLLADNFTIYSKQGAGNVNLWLQAAQTFSYIMDENADFILHGTSDYCYSYTASRGTIDFSDFAVKKMQIEYGSVRDATINVSDDLNAVLYYKGNLFYKGNPVVSNDEMHSTGRLIHLY